MIKPEGFSIGYVSLQTRLSAHVIRAWERRYKAVKPKRSDSGRRLFSQLDIERLALLKQLLDHGHRISTIAGLDHERLTALLENGGTSLVSEGNRMHSVSAPADCASIDLVSQCMQAVHRLDGSRLYQKLREGLLCFGRQGLLETVIKPLMNRVGCQWAEGTLRIVHGHLASVVVHTFLNNMLTPTFETADARPCLLVATPAGQRCHLGALALAVAAQDHGWRPVILGYNLPAEEIVAAYTSLEPNLIALSITCRVDDGFTINELHRLSEMVDGRCRIAVGGQASRFYRRHIEAVGGVNCTTLQAMLRLFD
ncbi:putative Transcriptional regulator, MerR family [Desulfosarcina cetonica]|uniref:MerR family transcriptional regulator n=1 Tax=Desulfosarcina cetonica TaxID=90730 RepID=UPI0006D251DC|nr:MerR family transcriptional regulator [Desulfosarcina cetonica]VTR71397.1 putative Transcriptional regulator, MerR family [Desulfosarcina cetonica]